MTHEEIYQQAVERYGVEAQTKMAIEEMAELTNALMKFHRGRSTTEDIVDEIADVTIMMKQLAYMFGRDTVQTRIDFKTQRLRRRLEENTNN